jgi:hypothetical protein
MIKPFPVQQNASSAVLQVRIKHLPGQHSSRTPHTLFLPGPQALDDVAIAARVVVPRSAAPSKARKAVRRELGTPKSRASRSNFRWSIACILRRKVHRNVDSRVDGNYAPSRDITGLLPTPDPLPVLLSLLRSTKRWERVAVDPETRQKVALKKGWPGGHPSPDCLRS